MNQFDIMAEAMINDHYRESVQSFDGFFNDSSSGSEHQLNIKEECVETKRVKHGPTTVIEIPEKRRKISTSLTASQVVDAISQAVSLEARREAICTATSSFDHNLQSLHDEELEIGADAVLAKHLGFLMSRSIIQSQDRSEPSLMQEICCTCEALEMVFRASPQAVSASFQKSGLDILATLIHLVNVDIDDRVRVVKKGKSVRACGRDNDKEGEEDIDDSNDQKSPVDTSGEGDGSDSGSMTPPSPTSVPAIADESGRRDNDIMLRKATKVLGHFARVGSATQPMAYHPGLLACLINILLVKPYHLLPAEVRLNSLWILANLACNSENMVMMACHPNLISSLVSMARRKVRSHDSVESALEICRCHAIASRALANLSWAPENQIPMSENSSLLESLSPLVIARDSPFAKRSRTVRDMMSQTRQHSTGTFRNLSAAPRRSKLNLCYFNNGTILDILTDAALNDPDDGVKEKAFATIQNLAIHDTAEVMLQHPALILALRDALFSQEESPVKNSASSTLMVLERSITPDMDQYQTLRELLDSLNPSNNEEDDDNEEGDNNGDGNMESV